MKATIQIEFQRYFLTISIEQTKIKMKEKEDLKKCPELEVASFVVASDVVASLVVSPIELSMKRQSACVHASWGLARHGSVHLYD